MDSREKQLGNTLCDFINAKNYEEGFPKHLRNIQAILGFDSDFAERLIKWFPSRDKLPPLNNHPLKETSLAYESFLEIADRELREIVVAASGLSFPEKKGEIGTAKRKKGYVVFPDGWSDYMHFICAWSGYKTIKNKIESSLERAIKCETFEGIEDVLDDMMNAYNDYNIALTVYDPHKTSLVRVPSSIIIDYKIFYENTFSDVPDSVDIYFESFSVSWGTFFHKDMVYCFVESVFPKRNVEHFGICEECKKFFVKNDIRRQRCKSELCEREYQKKKKRLQREKEPEIYT